MPVQYIHGSTHWGGLVTLTLLVDSIFLSFHAFLTFLDVPLSKVSPFMLLG